MKRIISVCLILAMLLNICGCVATRMEPVRETKNGPIKTDIVPTQKQTEEPTTKPLPVFAAMSYYKADKLAAYEAYKQLHPEMSIEDVVTHVNIGLDTPFYSNVKEIENKSDILVLCNKYNTLGADYEPEDLVDMPYTYAYANQRMRKVAAEAFYKLSDAAKADGYTIVAASTYRTYDHQKNLYAGYVASKGQEAADLCSAKPGTSEHQTGLAVDVTDMVLPYDSFGETEAYIWAKDNIHKYGFIIRYAEGKTPITGYKTEEWHFRYVGVDIATQIYEIGITYEEYNVRYLAQ